jgi:hypothetical protein
VLVHDKGDAIAGTAGIVGRDATSLAVIGEFHPGLFNDRRDFSLTQTAGRTILMFSRRLVPRDVNPCRAGSPRIDVFDPSTLALVNQINLNGRCPHVVPLPLR